MSGGCYQQSVTGPPGLPLQPFLSGGREGGGSWRLRTCQGETGWTTAWVPGATGTEAAVLAPPPPVVVARQAVDRLVLPRLEIGVSPTGEQLVSLPTWLWLDRGLWQPRSATASVPGVSVTVTARPTRVEWSMGDGTTVTCHGPGTPFPVNSDPRAASPDCGHTYTRSSAGRPSEAFPVTAGVFWRVTWSGGGESDSLPDLQTTSSATLRVAESQALVTGGGAG